jgi:tripartite-type tricarboxylate transporter receptor subunit TctC
MIASASAAMPHVKSGRLRALAVTSAQPTALVPGLPTVAATVPGYEFVSITGILTPAGIPASIVNRLNQEIVRTLTGTDVKEKFFNSGVEIATSSPAQLGAAINSEMTRLGKVIKDAGIKID